MISPAERLYMLVFSATFTAVCGRIIWAVVEFVNWCTTALQGRSLACKLIPHAVIWGVATWCAYRGLVRDLCAEKRGQ